VVLAVSNIAAGTRHPKEAADEGYGKGGRSFGMFQLASMAREMMTMQNPEARRIVVLFHVG